VTVLAAKRSEKKSKSTNSKKRNLDQKLTLQKYFVKKSLQIHFLPNALITLSGMQNGKSKIPHYVRQSKIQADKG
jgi:hypothetical protein